MPGRCAAGYRAARRLLLALADPEVTESWCRSVGELLLASQQFWNTSNHTQALGPKGYRSVPVAPTSRPLVRAAPLVLTRFAPDRRSHHRVGVEVIALEGPSRQVTPR